jgi:hypothetical protein
VGAARSCRDEPVGTCGRASDIRRAWPRATRGHSCLACEAGARLNCTRVSAARTKCASACPTSRCRCRDAARDEPAIRSLWHCRAIHCEPQTRKRQRRGRRTARSGGRHHRGPVKQPNRDQGQHRWLCISPPIMNGLRRAVCPLFACYGSISSPMAALMSACVRVGTPSLRRALSR